MGSLLDCLRIIHAQTGPNTTLVGILMEGHGPPNISTPAKFLFYSDIDTGSIYFNSTRDSDNSQPAGHAFSAVGGGVSAQDMQVAWTPTNLKLGEKFGYLANGDFPGITTITFNGATSLTGFDIESQSNTTALSWPNLVSIDPSSSQGGYFMLVADSALSSVSLPLLATVGGSFGVQSCNALASISAPSLVTVASSISIKNNTLMSQLTLAALVPTNTNTIDCSGNALNAASVNGILRRCVLNAGYVAGTVDVSGGTNAAPSGQGVADKATLIGRGVTVSTN